MKHHPPRSQTIVIVGPDLAAIGGVSTYTATLMSQIGNREAQHVNVWAPGHTQSSGWGWSDVVYHLTLMVRVARLARRVAVVHVMVTSLPAALTRELSLILIARLSGGNVLGHFHGSKFEIQAMTHRTYRWTLQMTLRTVSRGVVLSETMLRGLQTLSPSIERKMIVLENPVADVFFAIGKDARTSGPFRILCLGEVCENKGQLELMGVVDGLDESVQLVLGGPIAPHLKGKFEDALSQSQRTQYVGTVKGESLLALFRQTDCYCLFSFSENMPISILEAMAAGIPIVSTSVGAVPSVVTPDVGVIVAPGDRVALTQALEALQSDRPRCISMGALGSIKALERFSLAEHIEKLSAVYDALAESP
jgi:glycosyltransferase involved in cell wall biosynthesis